MQHRIGLASSWQARLAPRASAIQHDRSRAEGRARLCLVGEGGGEPPPLAMHTQAPGASNLHWAGPCHAPAPLPAQPALTSRHAEQRGPCGFPGNPQVRLRSSAMRPVERRQAKPSCMPKRHRGHTQWENMDMATSARAAGPWTGA